MSIETDMKKKIVSLYFSTIFVAPYPYRLLMKEAVLTAIILLSFVPLYAQRDQVPVSNQAVVRQTAASESDSSNLRIFPVPVKENNFTVTSEKEISIIRVTNIIGQEIYRSRFSAPVLTTRIFLDTPQRGFYLVTVIFADNTRVVRKIMVETI